MLTYTFPVKGIYHARFLDGREFEFISNGKNKVTFHQNEIDYITLVEKKEIEDANNYVIESLDAKKTINQNTQSKSMETF